LAFDEGGETLFVAGDRIGELSGLALLLDVKTQKELKRYEYTQSGIDMFAGGTVSADLSVVAIGTTRSWADEETTMTIRLWYPKDGSVHLIRDKSFPCEILLSPDGRNLVAWTPTEVRGYRLSPNPVKVWEATISDMTAELPPPAAKPTHKTGAK
jgi:hypothetical protein